MNRWTCVSHVYKPSIATCSRVTRSKLAIGWPGNPTNSPSEPEGACLEFLTGAGGLAVDPYDCSRSETLISSLPSPFRARPGPRSPGMVGRFLWYSTKLSLARTFIAGPFTDRQNACKGTRYAPIPYKWNRPRSSVNIVQFNRRDRTRQAQDIGTGPSSSTSLVRKSSLDDRKQMSGPSASAPAGQPIWRRFGARRRSLRLKNGPYSEHVWSHRFAALCGLTASMV